MLCADEEAMLGGECGREIWHQDKAVTRGRPGGEDHHCSSNRWDDTSK